MAAKKPHFYLLIVMCACAFFLTQGCQDRHDVVLDELAAMQRGLLAFREWNGDAPSTGSLVDCKHFIERTDRGRVMLDAIASSDLRLADLDRNECALLFSSGIDFDNESHADRFHSVTTRFVPDESYVTDRDDDGWPEYFLPRVGYVVLSRNAFEVEGFR